MAGSLRCCWHDRHASVLSDRAMAARQTADGRMRADVPRCAALYLARASVLTLPVGCPTPSARPAPTLRRPKSDQRWCGLARLASCLGPRPPHMLALAGAARL